MTAVSLRPWTGAEAGGNHRRRRGRIAEIVRGTPFSELSALSGSPGPQRADHPGRTRIRLVPACTAARRRPGGSPPVGVPAANSSTVRTAPPSTAHPVRRIAPSADSAASGSPRAQFESAPTGVAVAGVSSTIRSHTAEARRWKRQLPQTPPPRPEARPRTPASTPAVGAASPAAVQRRSSPHPVITTGIGQVRVRVSGKHAGWDGIDHWMAASRCRLASRAWTRAT